MKLETRHSALGIRHWIISVPAWVLIALLRLYQLTLSPLVGRACRFYPTCSQYWIEAIRAHGALKGAWLGVKRLLKCHPLHPGGVDLVPAARSFEAK